MNIIIIDKHTGKFGRVWSAKEAEKNFDGLTASKVRYHLTKLKKNCTKGRFIILRNPKMNTNYTEETLKNLFDESNNKPDK